MNIILDTLIKTILTISITAILLFIGEYAVMPNGKLYIDKKVLINKKIFTIIELKNTSKKTLHNLKINIPNNIEINNITTSKPISIKINNKILNSGRYKQLILNDIQSYQINRIYIETKKENVEIKIVNFNELNLELKKLDYIENPLIDIVFKIIIVSIGYFIALFIINYSSMKKLNNAIETSNKLSAKMDGLIKEKDKQIKKIDKRMAKIRIFLLARLNDHSKELSFWRDTIRKILYKSNEKNIQEDDIIDIVTKSLKTFKTKDKEYINDITTELLDKLSRKK